MAPKEIPDRWEPYIPIGSPVRGTRFIALKVPLKEHVCAKLQPKLRWTIDILTDSYPDIGMIVDLTLTTRYYNFLEVLNKGVDYCKVAIPGQQLPSESLVKRFFAAVDFYLDRRRDDSLIGVHCTHGVNRTGYMIARYMIQRMGFSVSDALESITVARGHPIERENYVSDLGRHLEKLPKVLDGSDVHKGRAPGEPPRMALGIKVAKKKKPMEPRMGKRKRKAARRRIRRQFLEHLRQLGAGALSVQQTEPSFAPCEVVVIDSSSEEEIGRTKDSQNSEGTESVSEVSIKVRNLEELMSTETHMELSADADQTFSGPSRSAEICPGVVICVQDDVSLANERFENPLQTATPSAVNPVHPPESSPAETPPIPVSKTVESVDPGGAPTPQIKIENVKDENENSTLANDEVKPDVRVAIRVKDISLLTEKSVKSEYETVDSKLKIEGYDSGSFVESNLTAGENFSTSGAVRNLSDIRLRNITSRGAVEKLSNDINRANPSMQGVTNVTQRVCHTESRRNLALGSPGSAGNFSKVRPSGVQMAVQGAPLLTHSKKDKKKVMNSSSCNTSGPSNIHGNSTSNERHQPVKRKYQILTRNAKRNLALGSSGSAGNFSKVRPPGVQMAVQGAPFITHSKNDKKIVMNSSSCNTSGPSNIHGNSTSNERHQPVKRKNEIKTQKARRNLALGSSGSAGDFSNVRPSGVQMAVQGAPFLPSHSTMNTNIVMNSSSCNTSGPSDIHGNSTSNERHQPVERKNEMKTQKSKKHKPNKGSSQRNNPPFQNFTQPLQMQRPIPPQPRADTMQVPYFYTESRPSSMVRSGPRNQIMGGNPYMRNQNLDKKSKQEMRLERKEFNKLMRWQIQNERNRSSNIPSRPNRPVPYPQLPSKNQPQSNVLGQQLGEALHQTHPPFWHQIHGTADKIEPWRKFGVASGLVARDSRLQRNFIDDSNCASHSREKLNSWTSKPTDFGKIDAAEGSNLKPALKRSCDVMNNPSSSSAVQDQAPTVVVPQLAIKTEKIPSILDVKMENLTNSGAFEFSKTSDTSFLSSKPPNSEITSSIASVAKTIKTEKKTTSNDESAIQNLAASEFSKTSNTSCSTFKPPISDSASTKESSASVRTSSQAKLPWTALSDTSWSSLFYK